MNDEIQIKHVMQPNGNTCVHSCLSMVTGIPVDDLIERFGDIGLTPMDKHVVLTEMGILPVQINMAGEFYFPWRGFYCVCVPSANLLRNQHAIVIEQTEDSFIVYDPNKGRENIEVYEEDCFVTGDGVFSYGDIYFLKVMPGHKGNAERQKLYEIRDK